MTLLAVSQDFQIKRYDSFTRQLCGWGFRRLDRGKAYVRKTFWNQSMPITPFLP